MQRYICTLRMDDVPTQFTVWQPLRVNRFHTRAVSYVKTSVVHGGVVESEPAPYQRLRVGRDIRRVLRMHMR